MENLIGKFLLFFTTLLSSTLGGSGNITKIADVRPDSNIVAATATLKDVDFQEAREKIGSIAGKIRDNTIGSVVESKNTIFGNVSYGKVYSNEELLALSGPRPTTLPLGDNKYTTDSAKKGYLYLCNVHKDEGQGALKDGPWIKGQTWVPSEKVSVEGSISWPNAWFKNVESGVKRLLTGNNLSLAHTTGIYPISRNTSAGKYDANPNSIKEQKLSYSLALNPTFTQSPNCMGGEVGVMLSGVPLFNGFDAQLRDAQAHEVQDSCSGHPQEKGEYHYHGMSNCFTDISVGTVLGYALDGFPITGPKVADNKYLNLQ